jgi:hypothetical protein
MTPGRPSPPSPEEYRSPHRTDREGLRPTPQPRNSNISIERCRELLGDEASDLTDDDVDRIRRCADTVAQAVIEMFVDEKSPTIH